jgi:hypothetical protein
LLDKGSADQVLVATDWEELLDEWREPSPELNRNTQVLLILPPGREHAAAGRRLADHPGPMGNRQRRRSGCPRPCRRFSRCEAGRAGSVAVARSRDAR